MSRLVSLFLQFARCTCEMKVLLLKLSIQVLHVKTNIDHILHATKYKPYIFDVGAYMLSTGTSKLCIH